jgi:hypothetical protein
MKNEMQQISKLFKELPSERKAISGALKWKINFLLQNNCKFL